MSTARRDLLLWIFFALNLMGNLIHAQSTSLEVKANAAYEAQEYMEALKLYQQLVQQDTTQQEHLLKLASSAFKLGDLVEARTSYERILRRDSFHLVSLRSLANIYEIQKNVPKAIKQYTALTKLLPNNGINFRKLGQLYKGSGLRRIAKEHYQTAIAINPRDLIALDGITELLILEKKYSAADSLIWQGLAIDSFNIDLNLLIATSKFRQKQYDSTAYYMMKIRGKFDFRPHQSRMLGYAFMQIDSIDYAIRYLSAAVMDEGTKEYAHYNLGVAYEKKGDTEYALHHFGEALKAGISENVDLYHRNLARLYNRENKIKEAIPHYKDAYKYGEDPILLFYLARASDAYYADKSIAIRYYNKFVKSNYDHEEYIQYAKDRSRQLVEIKHQQK